MKASVIINLLISLSFGITNLSLAQYWQEVGSFPNQLLDDPSITSENGNIYIVYNVGSGSLSTVQRFDGSGWQTLGSPEFVRGTANHPQRIVVKNGVPYIIALDSQFRLIVMGYDGTDWQNIGNPLSDVSVVNASIIVRNDVLYVAYSYSNANETIQGSAIKYFDGVNWNLLGGVPFDTGITNYFSFDVDDGTPYIIYYGFTTTPARRVLTYDGVNWIDITQGISSSIAYYAITIENGIPYLAYSVFNGSCVGLKVMTYQNNQWQDMSSSPCVYESLSSLRDLTINVQNGKPQVSCKVINEQRIEYLQFDGTDWQIIGNSEISTNNPRESSSIIINGTPYIAYIDLNDKLKVKKHDYGVGLSPEPVSPISIFPNPTHTHSTLSGINETVKGEIRDMMGRYVGSVDSEHISLESLESGNYLLVLETSKGIITKTHN